MIYFITFVISFGFSLTLYFRFSNLSTSVWLSQIVFGWCVLYGANVSPYVSEAWITVILFGSPIVFVGSLLGAIVGVGVNLKKG